MEMDKCSNTTTPNREDDSPGPIIEHEKNIEGDESTTGGGGGGGEDNGGKDKGTHADILKDMDYFLVILESSVQGNNQMLDTPEIPDSIVKFTSQVENEIAKYESGEAKWSLAHDSLSLLDAIDRLSKISSALAFFSSRLTYSHAMNRASAVVQRAMSFLEEEFLALLEDGRTNHDTGPYHEGPTYPPAVVEELRRIAGLMISTGYETVCCQVFSIARRNTFDNGLSDLGFKKIGIDEMQKMSWESLERVIATWIKAFRQSVSISFFHEHQLCEAVFSGHPIIAGGLFSNLARSVIIQLLNFAETVAMTKRSAEKLFKVLDMYEALRDMIPEMDSLFPTDLKAEISSTRCRLGEAAVAIFCDLESSIMADAAKVSVPGGAVHPLTRYVMNYVKYACEYKNTLEQVFQEHQKPSGTGLRHFASELMKVMELLHSNLESKSKLYKDLSLSYIFLMNNGRYIMQKIKGSAEAYELLGDPWCRKRSADLRQYHKNYQRETWSKVLGCFKDEGLQVKGSVSKLAVKERLKSFSSMLEEIHKTQSSWVVSDEQLQSELRVSLSAVVVPAYRSFLGRYGQYLKEGRQTHKCIKFTPEDLEAYIDDLFDGNHSPAARRKA